MATALGAGFKWVTKAARAPSASKTSSASTWVACGLGSLWRVQTSDYWCRSSSMPWLLRMPSIWLNVSVHQATRWPFGVSVLQLPTKTTATTHYGGLRISPDRPVEYAAWGKAKQLAWDQACDKDGNLCNICYDGAGNSIKVYFLLDSHGNPPLKNALNPNTVTQRTKPDP